MNDTKTIILQKSLDLFLQKSYREVTLDDIVKAIKLTKGAFYHYYRNKEEVFEECVRYFYNHLMITDFNSFPKASLKAFYKAYLQQLGLPPEGISLNPDVNMMLFLIEAQRRVASFPEIHASQRRKEQTEWISIIDRAKENKEINTSIPSEHVAAMFLNFSDGIALNRMIEKHIDEFNHLEVGWDHLYHLLGGL